MKYTALAPDVKTELIADPSDPVVERAVRNAAIEFCQDSWIWREYGSPVSITSGESRVDLEIPAGADLATVISVSLDGITLDPESGDALSRYHPRWDTDRGAPKRYTQVDPSYLILSPVPDANYVDQLVICYALMPKRTSTGFPDWIANQWWDGIVAGAVARLMLTSNRPWSDLKVGPIKRRIFDDAVAQAKESALRGLGRAPTRVAMQH